MIHARCDDGDSSLSTPYVATRMIRTSHSLPICFMVGFGHPGDAANRELVGERHGRGEGTGAGQ